MFYSILCSYLWRSRHKLEVKRASGQYNKDKIQNVDGPKNKDNPKNEDHPNNEDVLVNEEDPNNEENPKNKEDTKSEDDSRLGLFIGKVNSYNVIPYSHNIFRFEQYLSCLLKALPC